MNTYMHMYIDIMIFYFILNILFYFKYFILFQIFFLENLFMFYYLILIVWIWFFYFFFIFIIRFLIFYIVLCSECTLGFLLWK